MLSKRPPGWAERFFEFYCRDELSESILGDLQERFHHDCQKLGKMRAQLNYCLNILRFMNRYTLRKTRYSQHQNKGFGIMLYHHLQTAYRHLAKHKLYTALNIFGLAIGLASCLLIAKFLVNELSYDRFHDNTETIHRINTHFAGNSGALTKMVNTPPALIPGLGNVFPEVEKSTRLRYVTRVLLEQGDTRFYETNGFYADSLFLEIFSFPLVSGSRSTALDQPNSIVMSEAMASKYFGDDDPFGKRINLNNEVTLKVTGVLAAMPTNSHLQFDFLISFPTYEVPEGYFSDLSSWSWLGFLSYLQLKEDVDPAAMEGKLEQLYRDNTSENRADYHFNVQPLGDIYLGSGALVDDLASNLQGGNPVTLYALGIVALLILLIASFNFMNLSVAVSVSRAKEIGLRKMLGANNGGIIVQLLTESIVLATGALAIAYLLGVLAFPYVSEMMEWHIGIDWTQVLLSFPLALTIVALLGVLAGAYPAFILSGNRALAALKKDVRSGLRSGYGLRKLLIVLQFSISVALIASTIVVTKQIAHLSDHELGFDRENVLIVKLLPQDMAEHYQTLKKELLKKSFITSISRGERSMGDPWPVNNLLVDGQHESEVKQILGNHVGVDFIKTMGITIKEGRSFSEEFSADRTNSIILSEKAVDYLGLDEPIGKKVWYFPLDGPRTVIGVVEDFNFLSLHHEVSPMVLIMPFIDVDYMFVRLSQESIGQKIAALQAAWRETAPGVPLDFQFLDSRLNKLYDKEENLSSLISVFSGLAVMLACLGLYGLIAFSVSRRRKEAGIRKVLGASMISIMVRFSRQYIVLIALASLIAIPLAQYLLNYWLEGFAYRIEIGWWVYFASTTALILLAIITISHQAISAALVNPVTVLRDE